MQVVLLLISLMLVASCASSSGLSPTTHRIPNGVWQGSVPWTNVKADQTTTSGKRELIITACNGFVRVWSQADDDKSKYYPLGEKYAVQSNADTHLFFFIEAAAKQPDWVEVQTFSLLEITSDSAKLQWSRAVNNRDLESNHANRSFFGYGVGNLKRVSTECEVPTK